MRWMLVVLVMAGCGEMAVTVTSPDMSRTSVLDMKPPRNAHYCRDEATRANCVGMYEYGEPPDLGD